mgnify:CR=1 FL=1
MKIVVDTNILISALTKDSISREIIALSGKEFYYPEISFKEISKYKNLILERAGMDDEQFDCLFNELMDFVKVVSEEEVKSSLQEAKEIMGEIDPDDVIFIASALSLGLESVIWSDDGHFQKQNKIKVYTTKEIINELFGSY